MATSRSVKVVLAAQVNQFKADMAAAGKAASDAAKQTETAWDKSTTSAGKAMQAIGQYEQELTTAGTALATFGGVVVGAMGLSAKAAIDWESAWTGVLKTVDGTPAQLAKVESGLRDLAKTLPASHKEIAAVAEAAGQLGIETDSVVEFTKTMIDMGESTNITAEDAATSLARLANIMGTSQNDFDKMGASIVGLGNNFATTEREIVDMSLRIAAVGKQSGLTEGEVFGLATALSSVGIEAEAGGTAISMVMKKITAAVGEGGADLEEFARISGMSSDEFATAWQDDAAGALSTFVTGLHEADQSGENVNSTLSELGITGIRESDSLLRLAGASDVLTNALKMGNEEFDKGTALAEEAAKRYETAESKIKIAGNSLKDTAITIGGTFLPAIAGVAEAVAEVASAFGDLPEPVLKTGGAIAAIAGSAALGIGGIMLIIPKLAETATAFETLKSAATNSSSSMGKVSKAAGRMSGAIAGISKAAVGITAVIVAFQALDSAMDKVTSNQIPGLEKVNSELITLAKTGDALGDAFGGGNAFTDWLGGSQAVNNMADALEVVGRHAEGSTTGLAKFREAITPGRQELEKATDGIKAYDEGLASLTSSGQTELAQEAFAKIAADAENQGKSVTFAAEQFPEYKKALQETANQLGITKLSDKEYAEWMRGELPDAVATAVEANEENAQGLAGVDGAASDAATSLQDMLDKLLALGIAQQTEMEALDAFEAAIDRVDERIGEEGFTKTLDRTTQAGRDNRDVLYGIADSGRAAMDSLIKNGGTQEEFQAQLRRTYDELVAAGIALGGNADEANRMAREILGIPPDVSVDSWMDSAARKEAEKTGKKVDEVDKKTANPKVNADTDKANKDLEETKGLMGWLQRNSTVTISIWRNITDFFGKNPTDRSRAGGVKGHMPKVKHDGGIVEFMASGGLSIAEMVHPNTWRIVGDRGDVDEAYIPLDGSPRSIAILMEAIKRMPGFGGAMAAGGVTGDAESSNSAVPVPVPDTAPVTEAWQAMFDQMLTTTTTGWAAQVVAQTTAQATMLSLQQAQNATLLATSQAQNATMLTLAQGQHAAMQAALSSAFVVQNQTVATQLGLMSSTLLTEWSGMRATQASLLGLMQSNAATGFGAIRSGGESQMSALSASVAREMGEVSPETRSALLAARDVLNAFADAVNEAFGEIGVSLPKVPGFATGVTEVRGPGTGTSDSILARLSNGESVITADATKRYKPYLQAMNDGTFDALPGFAGGMVDLNAAALWLQKQGVRITEFGYWNQPVGGHSNGSYHYRAPGQAFDANYGPGGQNAIEMAKFDSLVPMINSMWPSLRTLWRVANHFNHLHVDTGGGGAGGAMGGLLSILGGNMPGDLGDAYAKAAKLKGGELVDEFKPQLPDNLLAGQMGAAVMSMMVAGLEKQARDFGDSFMETSGEGAGAQRWRSTVMTALQYAGLPVTEAYIQAWLRQIMSESGGDPNITQGVHDVNSGGNEAVGLVQVIPGTFDAFRDPSLPNDRRNPLANLVAGMNWAKFKYGVDMLDVIGHGHGYANGTLSARSGWAWVGEDGPELMRFGGGETVLPHHQSVAIDNQLMRGASTVALSPEAMKALAGIGEVTSSAVRQALDGTQLTLMVDGQPMEAFVHSSVAGGVSASRSRQSRSSRKTGAR